MSQLQILLTAAFLVALLLIVPSAQQGSTTPVTRQLSRCTSSYQYGYYSSNNWECGDGFCISSAYVCDGYYDCLNGSDESNCVVCRGNSFRCENKQCTPRSSFCDGIYDCDDGSDEPDSCPPLNALSSFEDFLATFEETINKFNPANGYGMIFGGIIGIILLFFSIIITIAVVITLCVCNKNCPIYKWRQRRGQPPLGVIVAEVPNDHETSLLLDEVEEESADEDTGDTTRTSLIMHPHPFGGTVVEHA